MCPTLVSCAPRESLHSNHFCFTKPQQPITSYHTLKSFRWRHNGRGGVSNHQPHDCLLNRLYRRTSTRHQSCASLAFVWGIRRWPHKWPVTWKMFPFEDAIMVRWRPVQLMFNTMRHAVHSEVGRFGISHLVLCLCMLIHFPTLVMKSGVHHLGRKTMGYNDRFYGRVLSGRAAVVSGCSYTCLPHLYRHFPDLNIGEVPMRL